jgi:hypothetical protein
MMLALPRLNGRAHGVTANPMTWAEYSQAWDEPEAMISGTDDGGRGSLVAGLAAMDMAIHSVTREDGSQFFWSRRDSLSGAVRSGELTVPEFTTFLEAMGETVIWPID